MLLKEKNTKQAKADSLPQQDKTEKLKKRRKIMRVCDRIFGFFLATGVVVACACLALGLVITQGPSPALQETFVMTMQETRRFHWVSRIFLNDEDYQSIISQIKRDNVMEDFDASLITIASQSGEEPQTNPDGSDAYGLVDDDGDGIILKEVKGNGYAGYMMVVLDPSRVVCGKPDSYGGVGLTLEEMVNKYDAVGGINGGIFKDEGGNGLGGAPQGLTIVGGECFEAYSWNLPYGGFDENNILHVGINDYSDFADMDFKLRDAASYGPIVVLNGEIADGYFVDSGINPRTVIGQRADGAVLMLVIDGRQTHSMGATYSDAAGIMLDFGAVNAVNMDGGSSTCMYFEGEYVNKCSAANGRPRPLPTAFLVLKEGK